MSDSGAQVWLTTLGCSKNQVDSDKLTAVMAGAGYGTAATPADADVVMVNTCAFVEEARRESIEAVLAAADARRPGAKLVVLGCLAQRYHSELAESLPEVDAVIGLDRYPEMLPTLDALTNHESPRRPPAMDILYQVRRPAPATPYAYVKVAEGCDKTCTFCAIPAIRGAQRSRPPVNIHAEVAELAAGGVSEVVLVAQDLAAYGRDLDAPGGIVELLRFLSDVEGLRRLRLLYLYPKEIRPALIAEMSSNPLIAPYFDLSLQHVSGDLLRAMRRPGDGSRHLELLDQIRRAAPDAATRSSFIVGFPGETERHVDELAEFLVDAGLDWAGFFPYSPEDGTPAAELPGRVDPQRVGERLRHLQAVQDDITAAANAASIGQRLAVLVDGMEEGLPYGRSHRQAPEIDGVIQLDGGNTAEWVEAEIVGAYGPDLVATVRL